VITCSSERDAERESSYVRLLRQLRAAAVIFAGSGLDDAALNAELPRHLAAMREHGAAVVHLSPSAEGEPEIRVDNVGGVAAMVGALVGLGHRKIAFLAGPPSLYVARPRVAGYRGPADAGIAYDARLVIPTSSRPRKGRAADRLLAGDAEFSAPLRERPDAPALRRLQSGHQCARYPSLALTTSPWRRLPHRACRPSRVAARNGPAWLRLRRGRAGRQHPAPPDADHGGAAWFDRCTFHHSAWRRPRMTAVLNLHGIIPACVVTFDASGRFDEAQYRRYLQWLLPQGPVALAINADTGEGPHLWPDERERVLRVAVDEAGDVPVIPGYRPCSPHRLSRKQSVSRGPGARSARVPDPGLPGRRSTRDPGGVPRGDRAGLRPADGRLPVAARLGRRDLQRGDAAPHCRHPQVVAPRKQASTLGCTCRRDA
jgi:hypothetical protein